MKIKGPGGPASPPDVGHAEKPAEAARGAFAERLEGGAPAPAEGADAKTAVRIVAEELERGTITPRQAVDRLVELTLSKSRTAGLPESALTALRAELARHLAEDPHLASILRRLGLGKEEVDG